MDAIYNERIKLLSTFVNGIGIATFAVGGLAPLISSFNGPSGPTLFLSILSAVPILAAGTIHYGASKVLKRIRL